MKSLPNNTVVVRPMSTCYAIQYDTDKHSSQIVDLLTDMGYEPLYTKKNNIRLGNTFKANKIRHYDWIIFENDCVMEIISTEDFEKDWEVVNRD